MTAITAFESVEDLEDAMEELSSAEDFLVFFDIPHEASIVHVNRLHIMQRYHDYLSQAEANLAEHDDNPEALFAVYRQLLARSYQDFVDSDALTEKVFKVFHMHEPQSTFVPMDSLIAPKS